MCVQNGPGVWWLPGYGEVPGVTALHYCSGLMRMVLLGALGVVRIVLIKDRQGCSVRLCDLSRFSHSRPVLLSMTFIGC